MSHSPLSPSSAGRWINCPGSLKAMENMPSEPLSEFAKEGTDAHRLADFYFMWGQFPEGTDCETENHLRLYCETVLAEPGELKTEVRLTHPIFPEVFGTADAVVESETKITVFDLKYGQGEIVQAENNFQLMTYARMALGESKKEIELVIVQPRIDNPIKRWVCTDLSPIDEGIERALVSDDLKAGSWCRWCTAKPVCPAIKQEVLKISKDLPSPDALSPEQIREVLKASRMIKQWSDSVYNYAVNFAQAGNEIPGYILKEKKGHRQWIDPPYLEEKFKNTPAAWKKEIKSPAQLEKTLKDQDLTSLWFYPSAGWTLIPGVSKKSLEEFTIE